MFVVLLSYVKPLTEVDRLRSEHFEYLRHGYDQGVFVVAGPRVPRTGGVIIARDVTRAELESIVKADPFVREGVATYVIVEFSVRSYDQRLAGVFAADETGPVR